MSTRPHDVVIHADEGAVDAVIARFLGERNGSRGVEAYAWLVASFRRVPDSQSHTISIGEAAAVVTMCNSSLIVHSLVGPDDERATLIAYVRATSQTASVRGLALPGDRMTKNLFEEAKMPAQILVH